MNTNVKTALITGASRGLGLALARTLAQAGWQLIINARGQAALSQAHQELEQWTTVTAVPGDISQKAHRQALAVAVRAAGGLDLLVNNAGILGPSPQPALLDYQLDVLETVFQVNVVAQLGVLQAVAGTLKPTARIINITSDAAVEPYAGWGGYGASKAAFEHLSAIFAVELADQLPDVRVYWVDPGDMRTQMHQEAFPGEDISDRPLPEASLPGFMGLINGNLPNGRYQAQNFPVEAVA
ncbi:SDR family NAD(P)-dependent oxidoreductase [Candidatus Leptofilum sp.]|uniref:SDR family NAD(P)-dependent oxidoreductase n=1 Tax=Candidatus Leptofilum sp. TaxID=3241576 RepID=UPI003B5936AE